MAWKSPHHTLRDPLLRRIFASLEDYLAALPAGGGGGYTDEQAQDAVGTILTDTATVDFTYNDAANTISAIVPLASLSTGHLNFDVATQAELNAHEADTTAIHGIADTSLLLKTADIGVTVQAQDAELQAIAGLVSAADRLPYFTGAGAAALATFTAAGRALVDDADAAAQRTTLGLVIGTNVEAWDADLDAIAALAPSNDDFIQRKAGAWANRTVAQVKTDLGVKAPTWQVFTSGSGTYTTPAGATAILVEVVAGGGGGGACPGNGTSGAAGGGGGSGGYARKLIASPAATYAYAVGAGGNGGAAGSNFGLAGSNSTFGAGASLITAMGGGGGDEGIVGTTALASALRGGGNGGAISTDAAGAPNVLSGGTTGQSGWRTSATVAMGGAGAPGPWGGGANKVTQNNQGAAATGPGAGGGGAAVGSNVTARAGGNGAAGIIIVTEFYG